MARLIVEAFSQDGVSSPLNREANDLVVSVTDANGEPIYGLGPPNFRISSLTTEARGTVAIAGVTQSVGGAFYHLQVAPAGMWKSGIYVFGVIVQRGAEKGQCLATVFLD